MSRVLLSCSLVAVVLAVPAPAPSAAAADSPTEEAKAFVKKSVLNGLTEDGVSPELAAKLAEENTNFVPKCKICESTQAALREYAARKAVQPPKDGKGLSAEMIAGLQSDKVEVRLTALRNLIERYIEKEFARADLTAEQKARIENELKNMRKEAEANLRPTGRPFCASCDGACRIPSKPKQ